MKDKEELDKLLLQFEWIILFLGFFSFIEIIIFGAYFDLEDNIMLILALVGFIPLLVAAFTAIKIEQIAGYYKCAKCDHTYVPTYSSVLMAPHFGRTRYMKCPKCNENSWNKKVLTK